MTVVEIIIFINTLANASILQYLEDQLCIKNGKIKINILKPCHSQNY